MSYTSFGTNRTNSSDPAIIGEPSDGRIVSHDKIYLGRIKDNQDENAMGRLRVWIRELCGPDEANDDNWILVSYATAFGGATPVVAGGQSSYGDWAVPPDLDVEVAIFFVNGDPNRGYWFAATIPERMNQSMTGATTTDGETLVTEADRNNAGDSTDDDLLRPEDIMHERVLLQGLQTDQARGMSYSSPRRTGDDPERPFAPARVYGRSTPAGHSMVMDDGQEGTASSLVRIRTAAGAQILMDDTNGIIYFISADGSTWLEMSDGNFDMYSGGSISLHSVNDVNIKADNMVKIEGGTGVFISSEQNTQIYSENNTTLSANNTMILYAENGINFKSDTYAAFEVKDSLHFNAQNDVNFDVDRNFNLNVNNTVNFDTIGTMNIRSLDYNHTAAGAFNLNVAENMSMAVVDFELSATNTRISGILHAETLNAGTTGITGNLDVIGSIDASGIINGLSGVANATAPEAPAGNVPEASLAGYAMGALTPPRPQPINRVPEAEPWDVHTIGGGGGDAGSYGANSSGGASNNGRGGGAYGSNAGGAYGGYYFGELYETITGLDDSETRAWLGVLASFESSHDYTIVNSRGFLGKYQFGYSALQDIGYVVSSVETNSELDNPSSWTGKLGADSKDAYLSQPQTQEAAIVLYTNVNYGYLSNGGVPMRTLQPPEIGGYLMGAHLVGHVGSRTFYNQGPSCVNNTDVCADATGTPITKYYDGGYNAVENAPRFDNISNYEIEPKNTPVGNVDMVSMELSPALTQYPPDQGWAVPEFALFLETLIRHWGRPVVSNSLYRSPAYNAALRTRSTGVASNSQHMYGTACDIKMSSIGATEEDVINFIKVASHYGVGGIGVYPSGHGTFIHVDIGPRRKWNEGTLSAAMSTALNEHSNNRFSNFNSVKTLSFDGRSYLASVSDPATSREILDIEL